MKGLRVLWLSSDGAAADTKRWFKSFKTFKPFKSIPDVFNVLNDLNRLNALNVRTALSCGEYVFTVEPHGLTAVAPLQTLRRAEPSDLRRP